MFKKNSKGETVFERLVKMGVIKRVDESIFRIIKKKLKLKPEVLKLLEIKEDEPEF